MIRQGLHILNPRSGLEKINLSDILDEIKNGDNYYWSILDLDASGDLGEGKSIPEFENKISKSERGFFIKWDELVQLSKKFDRIISICIIGSKDENLLRFYDDDRQMDEMCDIVIEMIDGWFWEVFSIDEQLIQRLASKFPKVKLLDSDYLK